ncbi:XisI protein [Anaerolineales bacterium HSG24]|nr:XisI protein [Anaerolineales bacterium HSG24]
MDKLVSYRTLIKKLLTKHAEQSNQAPSQELETELVFDEQHDHYMLFTLGWWTEGRVHGTTVHVRLRKGKFWIEEDWLEDGITTDLLEAGVPKEDIVLAFHSPKKRAWTEFAVA